MNGNRWSTRITDWCQYNDKRSKKKPETRWRDEIEKIAIKYWQREAQDRQFWKDLGKAYVQQSTYEG